MPNETTPDAPLTAKLGEQLQEKAHLEVERDAERRAEEERRATLERHKEDERENARRHAAMPVAARGGRRGREPARGWVRYAWAAAAVVAVRLVIARVARR